VQTQSIRKYELLCGAALCALAINAFSPGTATAAAAPNGSNDGNTTTPIKHVIVIIGEKHQAQPRQSAKPDHRGGPL